MAMQNMCKHATYYTDKISSSYLFVFCVRLKTFQPPIVDLNVVKNELDKTGLEIENTHSSQVLRIS